MTQTTLLYLHIFSGFVALVVGVVPMIAKKGGKTHILFGRIYFWAMAFVFISAVPLAIMKSNWFLFTIAMFSFYMAYSGLRFIQWKTKSGIKWFDVAIASIVALVAVGMLSMATYAVVGENRMFKGLLLLVFGVICGLFASKDLNYFMRIGKYDVRSWFTSHIIRMSSSYITTITAFLVTNALFLPALFGWLGPTVVGTIGISLTLRKYGRK